MNGKKSLAAILGVVAVVVVAVVVFVVMRKPTFDLNEYMEIKVEGYDGYGTAQAIIDEEKLIADMMEMLKMELDNEFALALLLSEGIDGDLSKRENVCNGEVLSYKWNVDVEELESKLGCKIKYSDIKTEVKDLEKAKEYDVFDDLKVTFTGVSPDGTVELDFANVELELGYDIEPETKLKNGDKVTVTLTHIDNADYVEEYCMKQGYALAELTHEYTVEGLDSYIGNMSEISEESMNEMKAKAEEAFRSYVTEEWDEPETFTGMNYVGAYLLIKNPETKENIAENAIFLIYKIDVTDSTGTWSYYHYTLFTNMVATGDGSVTVDLESFAVPEASRMVGTITLGEGFVHEDKLYTGFESLDETFKACVENRSDIYNYESTMQE